jgi:hypothetical protein
MTTFRTFWVIGFAVVVGLLGCVEEGTTKKKASEVSKTSEVSPALPPAKKVNVGKNVFLEIQGERRRVLVETYVCLRQGQLEQLLTRKHSKEHEAILAADVDARDIHTALVLARAEAGKPVQFRPKYQSATGTAINILLEYEVNGKKSHANARQWIRDSQRKKELDQGWVFAGSVMIPDPFDATKKPFYAANDGDIICVSNFDTAMLDLPVETSKVYGDLSYEAFTERIPPLETPVLMILEPVIKKK